MPSAISNPLSLRHALRRVVTAAVATAAACAALSAQAQWSEPPRPAFYEPPAVLPSTPGTVLRAEAMTFAIDPLRISPWMVRSGRILYTSTDRSGKPIAISGTVMVPTAGWVGNGSRPLIAVAPGTQGLADRCAPSRLQSSSVEYEAAFASALLARGYAVVMTDYQGLGTPGLHTYMNRVVQGRALLDAARAALRVPEAGLSAATRVGLVGYSQGGGAAASAAELWQGYAPELRVFGASVGAPPADLAAVGNFLDGKLFTSVVMYAALGLSAGYGIDLVPTMTEEGRRVYGELANECIFDFAKHAFRNTALLNNQGLSLKQMMQTAPFAAIVQEQRIGRIKPAMPVLVNHSMLDDIIPYDVGRTMAREWCAKGSNVWFNTTFGAGHGGGMFDHIGASMTFFESRVNGWAHGSNCGWF